MGWLATVERNPDGGFPSAAHRMLPDQRLFAVISGRDRPSASALESLARRGTSVAALVLEGFTAGDDAAPVIRTLQAARIQAVAGRKGAIEDAIQHIETGGTPRVAPRATGVSPKTQAPAADLAGHDASEENQDSPDEAPPERLAA